MTGIDHEAVRKEAKRILDSFSASLSKIDVPLKEATTREAGWREEGEGREADISFIEGMFMNAPHTNDRAVIAEKKQW